MIIIPLTHGYIVTDGRTMAQTFAMHDYASADECRIAAITFAYQMRLCYPRMTVLFRRTGIEGNLYARC